MCPDTFAFTSGATDVTMFGLSALTFVKHKTNEQTTRNFGADTSLHSDLMFADVKKGDSVSFLVAPLKESLFVLAASSRFACADSVRGS